MHAAVKSARVLHHALPADPSRGVGEGYPLRRYARLVGAPNYAPSLRSVAGLLLALALESACEDTLTSLHSIATALASDGAHCESLNRRRSCARGHYSRQVVLLPRRRAARSAARAHAREQLVVSERRTSTAASLLWPR